MFRVHFVKENMQFASVVFFFDLVERKSFCKEELAQSAKSVFNKDVTWVRNILNKE
jgi:hypothetical protein